MKKILSSILVIAILLIVGGIKVEASDLGVSEVQDMQKVILVYLYLITKIRF